MKFTAQKKRYLICYVFAMLVVLTLCVFYNYFNKKIINFFDKRLDVISGQNNLIVHFVSVGSADAVAINLPDEKVMIVDTADTKTNVTFTNYLDNQVFKNKYNKTIDYLFVTHAHMDHAGGLERVLKNYKVENLYLPKYDSTNDSYTKLKGYVKNNFSYQNIPENEIIETKDYKISVFGPYDEFSSNLNNTCPAIKLECFGKSFLFTGDMEKEVETKLVEDFGESLDIDVLKVAHHGSKSSNTYQFLQMTTPEYSVVCVGENSYGHPAQQTLDALDAVGSKILRTDKDGDIIFVIGKDYDLSVHNSYYYIARQSFDYRGIVIAVFLFHTIVVIKICTKDEKVRKRIKRA